MGKHLKPLTVAVLCIAGVVAWNLNEIVYRSPKAIPGLPPCPDCNVILVSLDTLRADALPCYGNSRNTAPNLCDFASRNILFSRFYSHSSFTLDSHMSIFTGLYPSTHHMLSMYRDLLNPAIMTLTQTLQNHGYRTIYAGLTDDATLPLDRGLERGFSEVYSLDGREPEWQAQYEKLLPKFLDGKPTFMFLHSYYPHDPYLAGKGPRRYSADSFPEIALTLEEFQAHARPFYRFALEEYQRRAAESADATSKTHNTAIVDGLREALASDDLIKARNVVWSLSIAEGFELYETWYWKDIDAKNPTMISYLRSLYDERINSLDEMLIPLLSFVSRPEIKRKTIVVFTSDHGEEFMEHGSFTHSNNIYNTTTHVPFILSAPRVKPGIYDALAQSIDIYPTLLEMIGVGKPRGQLEGKSLLPLLLGKPKAAGEAYLISQHRGDALQSIQDGRWKLYVDNRQTTPQFELYDLEQDPGEKTNVAPSNLSTVQNLFSTLRTILSKSPVYEPVESDLPSWMNEKQRQRLMREGYF